MKQKRLKLTVVALALALITLSVAFAVVVLTTHMLNNSMRLGASYGLELRVASEKDSSTPTSWVLVTADTAMAWGDFNEGQTHDWYVKLKNTGNMKLYVAWQKTGFSEEQGVWTVTCGIGANGTATMQLNPSEEKITNISLTEVAATPLVDYAFGVFFEGRDAA